MIKDRSRWDGGLSMKLTGSEDLIARILAFKKGKYNIMRRAARVAGRPLVTSLRGIIKTSVGRNIKPPKPTVWDKRKAAAVKWIGKKSKHAGKAGKSLWKSALVKMARSQTKRAMNAVTKDLTAVKRGLYKSLGIKRRRRKEKPKRGRPPKNNDVLITRPREKSPTKSKPEKPKTYTLNQISSMVTTDKERDIIRDVITNRNLLGTGKYKKQGIVREIGATGNLYRAVTFKIHMDKKKANAYDRDSGGALTPGAGSSASWKNAKWRSVSSKRIILVVGVRSMPLVAWNPFIGKLVRTDPKRYFHTLENGHAIVLRGRKTGKKTRSFKLLSRAWKASRSSTMSLIRTALADELKKEMAKRG